MNEVNTNNYVLIKGTIQKDPVVRVASTGMHWASWTTVVTSDNGKGKSYINCKAFGAIAEELDRIGKAGMYVTVEGKISTGSYTAKDGRKVYTTDVVADHIDYSQGVEPDSIDRQASVPTGFSELQEDFPF